MKSFVYNKISFQKTIKVSTDWMFQKPRFKQGKKGITLEAKALKRDKFGAPL